MTRNAFSRSLVPRLGVAALLALLPSLGVAGPVEDFHALDEQISAANDAYNEALEKIWSDSGARDSRRGISIPDPRPDIFEKMEQVALAHLGQPDGAEMAIGTFQWSWIMDHDLDRLPQRFERIVKYYSNEPGLDDVLPEAGYFGTRVGSPKDWLAPLEQLLERTKRKETKLGALLARGQIELGQGQLTKAKSSFKEVLKYGTHTDFADDAKRHIFEIERLQPGMIAPDFTAKTLDGKKVSLKSLRGKAVLLNFWATW